MNEYKELVKSKKMAKYQDIHLKGGAVVTVDWAREGVCKACGEKIWWCITKSGKAMPINLCGLAKWESHFASCPAAGKFRKTKTGVVKIASKL